MKFASVILDDNIDKPLTYSIPVDLLENLKPGFRVEVPIKSGFKKGFVLEIKNESNISNVKPIKSILSHELITKDLFLLALWMSKYYCCSLSKVFRCIVPTSIKKDIKPKSQIFLSLNKSKKETLQCCQELVSKNPLQSQILELFLKSKKGFFLSEILKITDSSKSPIDSLIKKKMLKPIKLTPDSDLLLEHEFFKTKPKSLNDEQQSSLNEIATTLNSSSFKTHLIHGVTGSGKTEIYLQAIQKALDLGKSSIMLVPEIALTSQTIERFKARFEEKIAILHHKRSHGERFDAWHKLLSGEVKIVVGARSAIFCPMKNLGLIIVDEEHDSSYKQSEEAPAYHARNIAVMRGKFTNAAVVLGSATPSIESYFNACNNKYVLSTLSSRATKASLPTVHIVDMKLEFSKNRAFTHFSEKLLSSIKNRYDKGEQTILFLNRRGYHNYLFCSKCAYVMKCPHCDISLTFHKNENILSCHSCDYKTALKKSCPSCDNPDQLQHRGFGTEHVEASLKAIFPEIRTLRVDRDTTMQKNSHELLFKEFKAGKADVLIGTQMIVKGLHFPSVSLVGVLNSDGALNIPDFRSSETIFQLITQVAGRSGRDELKGEVIIQTFLPENPTIQKASRQDYLSFYAEEIENRKIFEYPPFSSMIKVVFSGEDELSTMTHAQNFRSKVIENLTSNMKIHPLVASGRPKIKDRFYFQFLIRTNNISNLSSTISSVKSNFHLPSNIDLFIDVDPISTYF
jgi:primosomal protein N' (replication factor Y) (superfamily II helicase)